MVEGEPKGVEEEEEAIENEAIGTKELATEEPKVKAGATESPRDWQ